MLLSTDCFGNMLSPVMNGLLFISILFCLNCTNKVWAFNEARCSKYHYEEQILSKQIRMEIRLETLEKMIEENKYFGVKTLCDDEWIPFQSSCYLFGTKNENFAQAEAFCNIYGGHLVSIHNSKEHDFIIRHLAELSAKKFWIGMTDSSTEGVWRWIDTGEEVKFFDWGSNQPNQGKSANCAAIWDSFQNKYVDEPCTDRQFRPICKIKK